MIFTTRVCIGPAKMEYLDDVWCYHRAEDALAAAEAWNGEGDPPDGWHRHPMSGRRRPNGDPAREYVAP